MKLNRRKAMAAMVGGASAAPQAARAFAENIAKSNALMPTDTPLAMLDSGEAKQSYDPITYAQKLAQQKEYLTKLSNGDFSGLWHDDHLRSEINQAKIIIRDINIDALKSVSQVSRERIRHEKRLDDIKQSWIEDAKKRLLDLFNKKPGDIF